MSEAADIFVALRVAIDDTVEDPRNDQPSLLHPFLDIMVIVILGSICGAEGYPEIHQWAQGNEKWLKKFLELPHGIPSHYTLGSVLERVEPDEMAECFVLITQALAQRTDKLVSLDGKVLRSSLKRVQGKKALLMLSAWGHDNQLTLAQKAVEEGHNEITDLPQLIDALVLDEATVTIDAIGTQVEIAKKLRDKGADYILIAKDNQPNLHEEVREFFEWQLDSKLSRDLRLELGFHEDTDKGHGRVEVRRAHTYEGEKLKHLARLLEFPDVRTIVRLERERHLGDEASTEVHYYISSRSGGDAKGAAYFIDAIRAHWEIENKVHWVLDVCFGEDRNPLNRRNAAHNLGIIRRLALNLVRKEKSLGKRVSIKARLLRACTDRKYLLKILAQAFEPESDRS